WTITETTTAPIGSGNAISSGSAVSMRPNARDALTGTRSLGPPQCMAAQAGQPRMAGQQPADRSGQAPEGAGAQGGKLRSDAFQLLGGGFPLDLPLPLPLAPRRLPLRLRDAPRRLKLLLPRTPRFLPLGLGGGERAPQRPHCPVQPGDGRVLGVV